MAAEWNIELANKFYLTYGTLVNKFYFYISPACRIA
jgi:hypothetical protein